MAIYETNTKDPKELSISLPFLLIKLIIKYMDISDIFFKIEKRKEDNYHYT